MRNGISALFLLLALALVASCSDSPVQPPSTPGPVDPTPPPPPPPPPVPVRLLGLVEITLSGFSTPNMTASVTYPGEPAVAPQATPGVDGPSVDLVPLPFDSLAGIQLEPVSLASFTEGLPGEDGQRYVSATFRVRNATKEGVPYDVERRNVTFMAVGTGQTIAGTPVRRLHRFDGSEAPASIASSVVPTGAVAMSEGLGVTSLYPDVLQVFSEDEIAAFPVPEIVTQRFPYGFVVRTPGTPGERVLAADPGPNQFDGLVTFAFRLPLQGEQGSTPGVQNDPFSVSVLFMAVEDGETRLTESIEEQSEEGRAAVAARAAELGATTVTVLNGSPSDGYPGLRRICSPRTAGSAASPVRRINAPGAYTRIDVLLPGESGDPCAAGFRTGDRGRPGTNLPFPLNVRALDRYGNVKAGVRDTVSFSATTNDVVLPGPTALVSGQAAVQLTYTDYGTSTVRAQGRRLAASVPLSVMGITRTWTGAGETDAWDLGSNWDGGAPPMALDSVSIPAEGPAHFPVLTAAALVAGVAVENGATVDVGAFELTVGGDVSTGQTGGITASSGRVMLTGANALVSGVLPQVRVSGRYALGGDLAVRAPLRSDLGTIVTEGFRIRVTP